MKIPVRKFKQIRTAVSRMDGFHFTNIVYRVCPDAVPCVEQFFDGGNPYYWLCKQGIEGISLKDYRDYCVRWLDHAKQDLCV